MIEPRRLIVAGPAEFPIFPIPTVLPLGDAAILVRFATILTDDANRAAIACAERLACEPVVGVEEIVPNLVSVLVRYDPLKVSFAEVQGELRLRLGGLETADFGLELGRKIAVRFGGEDGPDLDEVAGRLGLTADAFIAAHNRASLRVLATGFAPGFVYCGFHSNDLVVPRRSMVRPTVPVGSVLFAAGQTAIAATDIPTGWHVIGRTDFRNFDPMLERPTVLCAGERLTFESVS